MTRPSPSKDALDPVATRTDGGPADQGSMGALVVVGSIGGAIVLLLFGLLFGLRRRRRARTFDRRVLGS